MPARLTPPLLPNAPTPAAVLRRLIPAPARAAVRRGRHAAVGHLVRLQDRVEPARDTRPIYLVSAAGLPNYGDEFITRAWLRRLAVTHPKTEVWLDCLEPGRAAFLFQSDHPRLRTTNTLWQLGQQVAADDPARAFEAVDRFVRELGTPRLDRGLEAVRGARSVHVVGGGYINSLWRNNLALLYALAAYKRAFGLPIFATGQGLLPQDDDTAAVLRGIVGDFDFFESRDGEGADLLGVQQGADDAFLALATPGVFDTDPGHPDTMILIQGDMIDAGHEESLLDAIARFVAGGNHGPDDPIGFVEAIPPDDSRFYHLARSRFPGARFYPFPHLWERGLPARPGQRWLTTRFHIHLIAAAGGAAGTFIAGESGYYDVKHRSLLELGTGWANGGALDTLPTADLTPSVDPAFPEIALDLAARKAAIADRLYPPEA